jgi:hypothetical protein
VYRTVDRDESDFNKRLNSTWLKMKNTLRVIHQAGAEDRAEISPVLRLIVDAEQIAAISGEYRRIVEGGGGSGVDLDVGSDSSSDSDVSGADDADFDRTYDAAQDRTGETTS